MVPKARSAFLNQLQIARRAKGFSNARTLRNLLEKALSNQSVRLHEIPTPSREVLVTLEHRDVEPDQVATGEPEADPLARLEQMIGLENVKKEMRQLADLLQVSKLRGRNQSSLSLHMIFAGGPGTGKTTVARLMGDLLGGLGVLSSGHLIEVDRSGLVAGFSGQTALKTSAVLESARGGVLYIDEAYALKYDSQDQFGSEAIDTLMKGMEDYREDMVVILSGYAEPMRNFFHHNPGLESRFQKLIEFPDYTNEQLSAIAEDAAKSEGFEIDPKGKTQLEQSLDQTRKDTSRPFANGRTVRRIMEQAYRNHASRISKLVADGEGAKLEPELLNLLTETDFICE